jgi:hypothetical protein
LYLPLRRFRLIGDSPESRVVTKNALFRPEIQTMGTEGVDRQQQKVQEFLRLMPLTLAVAGLPSAESGRHLNEGQMEARATTIRAAYKIARQVILDIAK